MVTAEQTKIALNVVLAVTETIREAGECPEGTLYAALKISSACGAAYPLFGRQQKTTPGQMYRCTVKPEILVLVCFPPGSNPRGFRTTTRFENSP